MENSNITYTEKLFLKLIQKFEQPDLLSKISGDHKVQTIDELKNKLTKIEIARRMRKVIFEDENVIIKAEKIVHDFQSKIKFNEKKADTEITLNNGEELIQRHIYNYLRTGSPPLKWLEVRDELLEIFLGGVDVKHVNDKSLDSNSDIVVNAEDGKIVYQLGTRAYRSNFFMEQLYANIKEDVIHIDFIGVKHSTLRDALSQFIIDNKDSVGTFKVRGVFYDPLSSISAQRAYLESDTDCEKSCTKAQSGINDWLSYCNKKAKSFIDLSIGIVNVQAQNLVRIEDKILLVPYLTKRGGNRPAFPLEHYYNPEAHKTLVDYVDLITSPENPDTGMKNHFYKPITEPYDWKKEYHKLDAQQKLILNLNV